MTLWPYFAFQAGSGNMTPAQSELITQLQTLLEQAGESDFQFALGAMLSIKGVAQANREYDEVYEYVGCLLCALQVEHRAGECQYWELSGKSSVGFNSDDVGGRALVYRKDGQQWVELHYSYLQDAQVVQLSRLQLTYPAWVHVGVDRTTYPGNYVCVTIKKDERHWPEWREEEKQKEDVWQQYRAAQHAARMRALDERQPEPGEYTYPEQRPPAHILRES